MSSGINLNFDFLLKNPALDNPTRQHLAKVYGALTCTVGAAILGVIIDLVYNLGGLLTGIGFIVSVMYLSFTQPTPGNALKRQGALMGAGFFMGLTMGDLISYAIRLDGGAIVMQALLLTICVFIGLSIAAFACSQAHLMMMVSVVTALGMFMSLARLVSMFSLTRGAGFHSLYLYGGLVMFSLYVILHTSAIVARFKAGDEDVVAHALALFLDFAQIFIRILVILMEQKQKEERRKDQQRRR